MNIQVDDFDRDRRHEQSAVQLELLPWWKQIRLPALEFVGQSDSHRRQIPGSTGLSALTYNLRGNL